MLAGIAMAAYINGEPLPDFTARTAIGALGHYVSSGSGNNFQPMNINFGIIEPLNERYRGGKAGKNRMISERSLAFLESIGYGKP